VKFSPTSEDALALLADAPRRIEATTLGVDPDVLRASPGDGEWSANDVLAHLRACADSWGGCIETMLADEHPTIRAINPRSWIKRTNYRDLAFRESFAAYAAQRAELITQLVSLPPDGWDRSATITGAGAPLQRTVLFYVQWLARHERAHIKQIGHIVAAVRQ
jgi:hypothetical protein